MEVVARIVYIPNKPRFGAGMKSVSPSRVDGACPPAYCACAVELDRVGHFRVISVERLASGMAWDAETRNYSWRCHAERSRG